jgi:transcriptional regulator with XRE-family HTH domain
LPKRKPPDFQTELRERLATLAAERSLSDIARRTGTSVANVSRYLSGTRIPADFCTALIRSLDVNPSWLMTGEGMPYVADITAGTVKMAGDVLELVEAMNAVTQMRLGALTGKHHLRVLRELNEALTRYERLRQRLNEHSAPIFARLLDDLDKALSRLDVEAALDLHKAAQQVERLCDDEAQSRRFARMQAQVAVHQQDIDAAIRAQQRLAREPLVEGKLLAPEQCEDALRLAVFLQNSQRTADALRLYRAFADLANDEARHWPEFADLRFFEGANLVWMGHMREGLDLMQHWQPRMSTRRVEATRTLMAKALLMAGLLTPQEALRVGPDTEAKFMSMTEVGWWLEDAEFLDAVVTPLEKGKSQSALTYLQRIESTRHILHALRQPANGAAEKLRKVFEERLPGPSKNPGPMDDRCAQVALLVRNKRHAAKYIARAREYYADPVVLENVNVIQHAVYLRNETRANPDSKHAEEARDKLSQYIEAGYRLFTSE